MKNVYVNIRIQPDAWTSGSVINGFFSGDTFVGKVKDGAGFRVGSSPKNTFSGEIHSADSVCAMARSHSGWYPCQPGEGIDLSRDGSRGFIAAMS